MPPFYIASALENAAAVRELADRLKAIGWIHTYDWTTHGSVQDSPEMWTRVAAKECAGVFDADIVFVLLPGKRGPHVELGLALASGATIVIVAKDETALEPGGRTCVFYHLPNVTIVREVAVGTEMVTGAYLDRTRPGRAMIWRRPERERSAL